MTLTLQFLQHLPGVAAVAQSSVVADLSRLDIQHLQNFIHHDGNMSPGGSFAALDDLLHISLIFLRIQLLVFLLKAPGVGALIADTAFVFLFHGSNSFYKLRAYCTWA